MFSECILEIYHFIVHPVQELFFVKMAQFVAIKL